MKLKTNPIPENTWQMLGPENHPKVAPYLASNNLMEAIELAMLLGRPLLVQGEPGSGKTQLAKAVAWNLYHEKYGDDFERYYREWPINSNTKARDGRYNYDHIQRLRDAQLAASNLLTKEQMSRFENPKTYLKKGVLWDAFDSDQPMVLLIDEIDKADIDFPNDLLTEMDQKFFYVDELSTNRLRYKVAVEDRAKQPLIIITSNQERSLPDAFLRRCIYFYIEFPDADQLKEIVSAHFKRSDAQMDPTLLDAAIAEFLKLHDAMAAQKKDGGKNVSTSELLDWCKVLNEFANDDKYKNTILHELHTLPFASVLLKNWEDHQQFLTLKTPPVA